VSSPVKNGAIFAGISRSQGSGREVERAPVGGDTVRTLQQFLNCLALVTALRVLGKLREPLRRTAERSLGTGQGSAAASDGSAFDGGQQVNNTSDPAEFTERYQGLINPGSNPHLSSRFGLFTSPESLFTSSWNAEPFHNGTV
jgi:hypothetical protein